MTEQRGGFTHSHTHTHIYPSEAFGVRLQQHRVFEKDLRRIVKRSQPRFSYREVLKSPNTSSVRIFNRDGNHHFQIPVKSDFLTLDEAHVCAARCLWVGLTFAGRLLLLLVEGVLLVVWVDMLFLQRWRRRPRSLHLRGQEGPGQPGGGTHADAGSDETNKVQFTAALSQSPWFPACMI